MLDVLVLGAGPAGLALAGELVARGLRVGVVAPDLVEGAAPAWRPTYCAWLDELQEVGHAALVDHVWPGARARFGAAEDGAPRDHDLPRAYARVDKARLAAHLYARAAGAAFVTGTVAGAEHTDTATTVTLADGRALAAAVVVDAAGHRPALLRVPAVPAPAVQTAVGRVVTPACAPWPADRAVLMDYAPVDQADEGPPTFLYVLPLGDGRWFVEETCLAARPALPAPVLTARLERRLAAAGLPPAESGAGEAPAASGAGEAPEERVSIPMGGALPHDPRVLGFGAAAGMIHPASGYLLPRVLGAAPGLAEQIALTLGARGGTPARAVATGWATLWPPDRRQRRALYRFGLEALLAMDPARIRAFFHHFFQLPGPAWSGYLSDRLTAAELRSVMLTLFGRVPPRLKWSLARAGLGAEGWALAREMFGG